MTRLDIKEAMERWARWRFYKAWHELGYGECVSGRLLTGIKRIPCTAAGCTRGEVLVTITNQKFWLPCTECNGSGYISAKSTATKINPKLIRGTGGRYPDEQSASIDRIVCGLTRTKKRVILQEFCWNGTQQIKATRLRIDQPYFSLMLKTALAEIEKKLKEGLKTYIKSAINN